MLMHHRIDISEIKSALKELTKFGIPRAPGSIALAGLFTMGPLLASNFGTLKDAGILAIGQSVLRIAQSSVGSFGLVALPKVSQMYAQNKYEALRNGIRDLIAMVLDIGLFLSIQIAIWSDNIINIWLGDAYFEAGGIIRILMTSLCPYLGYVMMRSILDAVEVKAINTLNLWASLSLALCTAVILHFVGWRVLGIAVGMATGFFYLGGATALFLLKRFRISLKEIEIKRTLALNVIFGLLFLGVKLLAGLQTSNLIELGILLVSEVCSLLLYLYWLNRSRRKWIFEVVRRFRLKAREVGRWEDNG